MKQDLIIGIWIGYLLYGMVFSSAAWIMGAHTELVGAIVSVTWNPVFVAGLMYVLYRIIFPNKSIVTAGDKNE